MKKKVKKIWILSLMCILMWTITGCNSRKTEGHAEQEKVHLTEEPIQNTQEPEVTSEPKTTEKPIQEVTLPVVTADPEVTSETNPTEVPASETIITYGDKVNISYTKTTEEFQWEYTGTQEFQVATSSLQFQNEFDDSEEAAMMQVEEAIGKTVGDTFILWYEGGDGRYGYEYTIKEVKSQNPDIIEYGDTIVTEVREANTLDAKCYEEHAEGEWVLDLDAMEGHVSLDGEPLSLENLRIFYKGLIGKKAGDWVVFIREDREKREIYAIMIQGVTDCESEYTEDMEALFKAEESEIRMFYFR